MGIGRTSLVARLPAPVREKLVRAFARLLFALEQDKDERRRQREDETCLR